LTLHVKPSSPLSTTIKVVTVVYLSMLVESKSEFMSRPRRRRVIGRQAGPIVVVPLVSKSTEVKELERPRVAETSGDARGVAGVARRSRHENVRVGLKRMNS